MTLKNGTTSYFKNRKYVMQAKDMGNIDSIYRHVNSRDYHSSWQVYIDVFLESLKEAVERNDYDRVQDLMQKIIKIPG